MLALVVEDQPRIPSRFSHILVVQKPYTLEVLAQTLSLCLTAGNKRP